MRSRTCHSTGTPASRPATPPSSAAFSELVCTRSGSQLAQPLREAPDVAGRGGEARQADARRRAPRRGWCSRPLRRAAAPRWGSAASRSSSSRGPCSPRITWGSTSRSAGSSRARASSPPESRAQWSTYTTRMRRRSPARGPRESACCERARRGRPSEGTGGGTVCRPASASALAHRVDERVAGGDHDGIAGVAEAGDRGGHRGPADREALVGLDRVEALGERRDHVRHDHHVGVLEVGGDLGRTGACRPAPRWVAGAGGRGWSSESESGPTSTTVSSGSVGGQALDEVDVDAVLVQGADVDRHVAGGQVGGARSGSQEVVGVDRVGDHHEVVAHGAPGRGEPRRAHHDRVAAARTAASRRSSGRAAGPGVVGLGPVVGDVVERRPARLRGQDGVARGR